MEIEILPITYLIILLTGILLLAKAAGYLSIRLGQPSVLGELLVGVVLGPSLLNVMGMPFFHDHAAGLNETIKEIGELGVFLLMFIAGLELHLHELRKNAKVSALGGILGVVVPALAGYAVGYFFGLENEQSIFLGLTIGATSVSISAQTLMEMKVLRSRVGLGLLGAAVFDDVLVILFISIFFALIHGAGGFVEVMLVFGQMVLFFVLAVSFGMFALPKIVHKVRGLPISQNVLSLAIIIMLSYAIAAELIGGMAAITGTFLAGLMFARTPEKEILEPRVHALAYSFFVPVFFVSIGLEVDLRNITNALGLAFALTIVAILGKILGSGLGAKIAGFTWKESLQLGTGMVSRGEVGLIVASTGLHMKLMNPEEFSAIIGMVIVTTLITPPMLRALFRHPEAASEQPVEQKAVRVQEGKAPAQNKAEKTKSDPKAEAAQSSPSKSEKTQPKEDAA